MECGCLSASQVYLLLVVGRAYMFVDTLNMQPSYVRRWCLIVYDNAGLLLMNC